VEAHKGTEDGGLPFSRFDFAGNDELSPRSLFRTR
jgi:hypothetical protein